MVSGPWLCRNMRVDFRETGADHSGGFGRVFFAPSSISSVWSGMLIRVMWATLSTASPYHCAKVLTSTHQIYYVLMYEDYTDAR